MASRSPNQRPSVAREKSRYVLPALWTAALAGSGVLMACSAVRPELAWLRWFSLLPLFFAIRMGKPIAALLAGALWGAGVYGVTALHPAVGGVAAGEGAWLLIAAPAIYAGLGALLTRWVGFSPFVLGVGWMGVELALSPWSLGGGLLGAFQSHTGVISWIGSALGYVLVAFVVATVNASLVCALSVVRLPVASRKYRAIAAQDGKLLVVSSFPVFSIPAIEPSQPRAPPGYII